MSGRWGKKLCGKIYIYIYNERLLVYTISLTDLLQQSGLCSSMNSSLLASRLNANAEKKIHWKLRPQCFVHLFANSYFNFGATPFCFSLNLPRTNHRSFCQQHWWLFLRQVQWSNCLVEKGRWMKTTPSALKQQVFWSALGTNMSDFGETEPDVFARQVDQIYIIMIFLPTFIETPPRFKHPVQPLSSWFLRQVQPFWSKESRPRSRC